MIDNSAANTSAENNQQNTSSKKKVLIVEDDFFIRDLYEFQARKSGYEVIIASDGEEGASKAMFEVPDLILSDLMLPKLDGISLIKKLKADPKLKDIPFILITNLEDSSKEQEARDAGAIDYMLKIKVTPEKVIEVVKKYLQ